MEAKFRLNAQKVFLTYPKCHLSRESVRDQLVIICEKGVKKTLKDYIIAQEKHKDGDDHIHVYADFTSKIDVRRADMFDLTSVDFGVTKKYHGNYQGVRSMENTIQYVIKSDKDYIASFDPNVYLMNSKNHMKREKNLFDLNLLMSKGAIKMVKDGDSHYTHLKRVLEVEAILRNADKVAQEMEKPELPSKLENDWNLNLYIDLDLKKCHFLIFSKQPNRGKTTFLLSLMKSYRCYMVHLEEKYQDLIYPQVEAILIDEFRGQLTITQLNSMCDGTYQYPRKGLSPVLLEQKPLVIVCSNRSWEEIYPKNYELVEARFNSFNID